MNQSLFAEYFTEERNITSLPNGPVKKLYIDCCRLHDTCHALFEAVASINTEMHILFINSTHLVQTLDHLVVHSLKVTVVPEFLLF